MIKGKYIDWTKVKDIQVRYTDSGRKSVFENIGFMNKEKILNIIADEVKENFKD